MLALLPSLVAAQSSLSGPPNRCDHPFWRDTLRCRAVSLAPGSDVPQPNATDRPAGPGELRDYTRVFLSDHKLRCVDGTRPAMYVSPGRCTNPDGCSRSDGTAVPPGAPVATDDWVISFTGGGACHARDTDGDGVFDDGRSCTDAYPAERSEMSTAFAPPMKNLGSAASASAGITSRDAVVNPVFAGYNSVRVEKCSYDRFNGRATRDGLLGSLLGQDFRFTLFNHGQLIATAAVDELLHGLRYTTWEDRNGDGVVEDVRATLPPLARARQVLLVGHSGGAHGLRHNVDHLAARIRQKGGTGPDVRALFDANFLPSVEGEAAFAPGPGGDAYSDQWTGSSTASGVPFTYDGESYHRDNFVAKQLDAWDTALDESCLAAHDPSTRWKCRDRQHVLFNHVSTPMFVREDQADPNGEHLDGGAGHPVPWARPTGCDYADAPPAPGCDARFAPVEHRSRLLNLATTLLRDIGTRSEIGRGADRSLPAGRIPSVYLWMPVCFSHEGAYANPSFFGTAVLENGAPLSMREAVEAFVAGPALDNVDWRIHGAVGGRPMTSDCP